MLAAYILESNWGTSRLAQRNHNYFGITGTGTAGYTQGSHKWAKYYTKAESFMAFGRLVGTSKTYAKARRYLSDRTRFIKEYTRTYAPASDGNVNYAGKMINLINRYKLTQYDSGGVSYFGSTESNVRDLISYASDEVGHRGGSKYGAGGAAWCQYFASWCGKQAGVAGTATPVTGSTSVGMQWFKDRGRFRTRDSGYVPQRNDFVYYKTGASHVGIVEYWDGSALHTIEGNYSKKVTRRTVPPSKSPGWNNITGYGLVHDYIANADGSGSGATDGESSKEITTVTVLEDTSTRGVWENGWIGHPAYITEGAELTIAGDRFYNPAVKEDIQLEQSRKGSPSKLTFTVLKDSQLSFAEGNPVTLRWNGNPVFAGYVFEKTRTDNDSIKVTAYDQLRYLKSKDTYAYSGITATDLLKQIANDYQLKCGAIEDTVYHLPQTIKEDTLMDIIANALDDTVLNTGRLYVLWDDFGKIRLTDIQNLTTNYYIDDETAEKFSYTSTIDKDVYTKVKIAYDDKNVGTRLVYTYNNTQGQTDWGVLPYYEKISSAETEAAINAKAAILLNYYGKKKRSLTISGCMGNTSIHGGSSVVVRLNVGDLIISNRMVCESVTHHFKNNRYTMDLKLAGIRGEFQA